VSAQWERLLGRPYSRQRHVVMAAAVVFWLLWMLADALIGAELGFTGDGVADALLGAFAGAVLWAFMFSVLRLVLGLRMSTRRASR
jgi:hypothetical protein